MKSTTKGLFVACACIVAFIVAPLMPVQQAHAAEGDYQIYPTVHSISYSEGTQTIRANATTVVEEGIDAETQARLSEVLALKGVTATPVAEIPKSAGTTSILVGINGSGGAVDAYVKELVEAGTLTIEEGLFDKTDAYFLASIPGNDTVGDQIIVLGKDTDSAFYGLTTLYQIFQQISGAVLRAFSVNDYADVKTRGFIEGYYGNPWSVEDRVNLMKWGGYYKLNAYVYAPKDDPKHNSQWRELYTDAELAEKIDPVAQAGNESKTRFIFALHPFMNNPMTSANYDETLPILKAKFTQVMDHGVRQIAILADDAGNQGSDLYTKLLEDMTAWIQEQQKAVNEDGTLKYPGLKDTIIFCPVAYYGSGESWYGGLPENIQVVNTGGRVWGKIDNAFATTFMNNSAGRAPFMWINWPCSDNDKDALHMGGHNNFLGSDVQPGTVEGVVLNPMQQSEPSKQAIFMNADFSWNLWKSTDHADQAWEDSFSYVDHNSPVATTGSKALHDLSVNMVRMYGGGATWINDESAAIEPKLTEFRQKLAAGTVTQEDCEDIVAIFLNLQQTAAAYRASAGTPAMLEQMTPWIDTWDQLTAAALLELDALKAHLAGDASTLIAKYSEGTATLDEANGNGFFYVDHTEYARVGKHVITPTVVELDQYVGGLAELASNPDAVLKKFVTSRTDTPEGSTDDVFDGNATTGVKYKTPASVTEGTYFGFQQSAAFDLTRFTVTYDAAHLNDTIRTGKLQVLRASESGEQSWVDVPKATISGNRELTVDFQNLDEKGILGVRLIATADNEGDCWLTINEIEINKSGDEPGPVEPSTDQAITTSLGTYQTNAIANAADGDDATKFWSNETTAVGDWVMLAFGEGKQIDSVRMLQGTSDRFTAADVFVTSDAAPNATDGQWTKVATLTGDADQTVSFPGYEATAIKVVATAATSSWFQLFELSASEQYQFSANNVVTTFDRAANDTAQAQVGEGQATMKGTVVLPQVDDVAAVDLGNVRRQLVVSHEPTPTGAELVYSQNGLEWLPVADAQDDWRARYVGYRATSQAASVDLTGFSVTFLNSLAPSLVSSDVSGSGAFDAAKVFDGDVSTASTVQGTPSQDDTIVFDLGQVRHVTSLEYFVPETSLDFIRNAVIEVADSADAQTWTPVLDINSESPVENTFNNDTAKDATWLTHSSEFPGNMTIGNDEADATGQFMRVRFTATYGHRWVSFGELRINDGEYVSTYTDGDFDSTATEQQGHTPDLMLDQNLASFWAPQGEAGGTLTYLLSTPLKADGTPYQGVRIISRGTPSNATVKAEVYTDDTYTSTTSVTLGTLSLTSQEFTFGEDQVVKNIVVEWPAGVTPQISELYLLGSVTQTTDEQKSDLQTKIDAASKVDTAKWTKDSKEALDAAIAAAQAALKDPAGLTGASVQYLIAALDKAMEEPVLKYTGTELSELVDDAVQDGEDYTATSWQEYQEALTAAQKALEDADNLSQSEGESLATTLQAALDNLTWDAVALDRAKQSLIDSQARFGAGEYTTESGDAYDQAVEALQTLIDSENSTPAQLETGMAALEAAQDGLVDVSALKAERTEFDKVDADGYTAESYAAYKAAFDASTPLLENGTAEQISEALTNLQEARAGLKTVVGNDDVLKSLISEAEKLKAEDYTVASWKPLAEALDAARDYTGTDQAEIDKLAEALTQARANLVNVTALKDAVANADGLDLDKYTKESAGAVTTALENAEGVLQDGTAEEVEQARQALADAVKGLELLPQLEEGTGGKSGIPATGSSATGVLVALTAFAAAGIALVTRRNRKD